jgi:predicted permease
MRETKEAGRRIVMLTVGFIAMVFMLIALVGVFALIAKDQNRRGQSGSQSAAGSGKEGGAIGHH